MFKKAFAMGMVLVAGSTALLIARQEQEKINEDKRPFMQRKLDASREIVKGLSLENYDIISQNAQELMTLSHEAQWKAMTTPEYLRMSSEFRGSAQRLRDGANDENLNGATLAYFEVTLNCVRCHQYIRKEKRQVK